MEIDEQSFLQVQAPKEEELVDLDLIKLNRNWVFWENYEAKGTNTKLAWESSIKKIFKFNEIITFWQFWNYYPGSDPSKVFFNGSSMKYFFSDKLRIVGLNLFEEGISPRWEDPLNANGTTLTLNYEVRDRDDLGIFLNTIKQYWTKLIVILLGEGFKMNKFINGIRLIDKSQIGKKTLFRIEIWIRKGFDSNEIENLKSYLGNLFGTLVVENKIG